MPQLLFAWGGKASLKEITINSQLILKGKVVDVSVQLETEENQEHIYTYVIIAVNSILKGKQRCRDNY